MTHIFVSDLTSIGSDNGLSPGRRQAIIRTNAVILLIRPLGTNFSESLVEILIFLLKKMCLKVSSAKRRPFCVGLNELKMLSYHRWQFSFFMNYQMDFIFMNYQMDLFSWIIKWTAYLSFKVKTQGPDSIKRCRLTSIRNPIVEIRQS